MAKKRRSNITEEQKDAAVAQIRALQKEVKFTIRDYPIEVIVKNFRDDIFYIPHYQRGFVWSESHQSKFIESVILGLPIPMMFLAEMENGTLEIVDGAQRIQTLESFMDDQLKLPKLEKLPLLKNFRFTDIPIAQRRKLWSRDLRLVILEEDTTVALRHEIFDRVNTTGVRPKPSEVRRGAYPGRFMDMIDELAADKLLLKLCPISKSLRVRRSGRRWSHHGQLHRQHACAHQRDAPDSAQRKCL